MILSRKEELELIQLPQGRIAMKKLTYKVFALVASLVALGLAAGAGFDWS
jgi:hypothetical protein